MNEEQTKVYNSLISGKNIFISGGGGVGKTYIIKRFYNEYKLKRNIGLTSTTGSSAVLINGSTLYSFLGIGLGNGDVQYLIKKIKKSNKLSVWSTLDILIIDEVSMLNPDLFDKLNDVAKSVRNSKYPFGGIQLILSGDFCQLPCVNCNNFCFESKSWKECIDEIHILKEIVRQKDDYFMELLNEIRIGKITKNSIKLLKNRIIEYDKKSDIIPTILYPDNRNVDDINNKYLAELLKNRDNIFEYVAECDNKNYIPMIPDKIQLVENTQVMLTYNISVEEGLVNGSRGVVKRFNEEGFPVVKFLNGIEKVIEYNEWKVEDNKGKYLFSYYQLPLKLAWAITIHKSQGMSLDLIQTDLTNTFEYGQIYVCLSRLKTLEGLFLSGINFSSIKCHPKALEFYKDK